MSGTSSDPFFWNDWQGDPLLRMCSFAAQGYWMRLLCISAESNRKGFVLVNGKKPSDEELHKITGAPLEMIPIWTGEILSTGTASITRHGIIYNRKLVKAAKKQAASKKGGKIGGRTTRDKQKGIFSTQGATQEATQEATQHPRRAPLPFPSPQKEEEVPFPKKGKGETAVLKTVNGHPAVLDPWKAVYDRGREILGREAGGVITKLRKLFDEKPRKVLAKLEDAAEQRDPLTWICAFLWNAKDDGRLAGEYIGGVPP